MRKSNVVEGGGVDVARGPRVQAMKFRYDIRRVDVPMYYPGVVADVIALPFDQVLQTIPAHAHVQYSLYFVFLFAFYQDWKGRGSRASADDGVRSGQSERDDGEHRVQSGKTLRELQMVCTMADMNFNWIGAQMTMGELYRWPISSDISSIDPDQI